MRLILDLFACQTDSRLRGIGRYTLSLAKAMAAVRGEHELRLLANALYPEHADTLRCAFGDLPPGAFATYSHPPVGVDGKADLAAEQVGSALIHAAYHASGADAVLCGSPFEGWGERGLVAQPANGAPHGLKVAVLYDFIPMLFPAEHLDCAPDYHAWYLRRLDSLKQYDLLLAISEATRHDAIELLGIAPERVVNISGAADSHFRRLSPAELQDIDLARFHITRPFVLYTGNGDFRKNLAGMIEAYASLPAPLRASHQLVLNQVGDAGRFSTLLRKHGLRQSDVVVTGHITDEQLCALYNRCKVFVFPSLYEGFGLPLLEAMTCGAPVLAADNSAIPEVTGRADLLFDASVPRAIGAKLERALLDDAWRAELGQHGPGRAAGFSWQRTARLAWSAIEAALAASTGAGASHHHRSNAAPAATPRRRIAVVTAAQDAAAAARAASLIDSLAPHAALTRYGAPPATEPGLLALAAIEYDCVLYIVSRASIDTRLTELMRAAPGVLLLDPAGLDSAAAEALTPVDEDAASQVLRDHGLQGLIGLHQRPARLPRLALLGRSVLEAASHLLIDAAGATALRERHGAGTLPPLTLLDAAGPNPVQTLAAIDLAIARSRARTAATIAGTLMESAPDAAFLMAVCDDAERNAMLNRGSRLLIDVTQLSKTDAMSGIQRVVRNISLELCQIDHAVPIELVELRDGVLTRASGVAAAIAGIALAPCPFEAVDIQPGDTLLMIDSSWEQYPDFEAVFASVRQYGGRIVTVVYDLIPLRMPQYCSAGLVQVFERWFALAVEHSDMLLCISRAVRDDVALYLDEMAIQAPRPLRLEYWQLGADILPAARDQSIRPAVAAMIAPGQPPLFLMVGTIEPRKGHDAVLDAFDALWETGSELRLCFAGKEGWHVDDLMARIRQHPELGKRLHFVERFSDAEINLCYGHAHALIVASVAEGYGLPIVEAARHGVPVIASDIAVFREVAGDGAEYFGLGDQVALMAAVERFAGYDGARRRALASRVSLLSWRDSARQLAARLATCFAATPAPKIAKMQL